MNSHEIDYELIGDDMQIVEIELDPGETVIAKAGAMNYMDDQISFEVLIRTLDDQPVGQIFLANSEKGGSEI